MTTPNPSPIKHDDRVKLLHATGLGMVGRVVELRGPLGPKGAQVYRILLQRKPKPAYVEVLEHQLEVILPNS